MACASRRPFTWRSPQMNTTSFTWRPNVIKWDTSSISQNTGPIIIMSIRSLRIIYMGTPGFAVPPLKRLVEAGCNVVAVITAPDRPAGRGKKIRFSEVKEYALSEELNILQPENLKSPEFISSLEELAPDLQVVVAFRMLPEVVWRIPSMGTFNLHASLLPDYRGAAPINHAIINGESRTGVTSFLIDAKIDTGNILLQEELPIGDEESAGELHDRLMEQGAEVVLKTVEQLTAGTLEAKPQDELAHPQQGLKSAPKIHKPDCQIKWDKTGREIHNLIRGLSPYPAAFSFLEKEPGQKTLCKVYASQFESKEHSHDP
ncbi:MAG: methionyl-tRNA formyltransferase, partial [Bacteroidetes bacterium]|nr:methionyl-tRNA formyltransferase [Bacteroidota bacterium]